MGKRLERMINGTLNFATNVTFGAAAIEGIKYVNSTDVSDATAGLLTLGTGASILAFNKSGLNTKLTEKIRGKNKHVRKKRDSRLAKFALISHLGIASLLGANIGQEIFKDCGVLYDKISSKYFQQIEEVQNDVGRKITYEIKPSIMEIISNDKHTSQGRFDRTYRWDDLIDSVEMKYNLEKGVLAGTIMQESYGNPTQLPKRNDAGAGIMMFQPGTAKAYGLKVWGDSNATGRDNDHGAKLRELAISHGYSYDELSNLDERFHVPKAIDAGGKFLKDLHKRFGTWDGAISAYNSGTPESNCEKTRHVKKVREFQRYYNKRDNN
jgi:hypothetical protein